MLTLVLCFWLAGFVVLAVADLTPCNPIPSFWDLVQYATWPLAIVALMLYGVVYSAAFVAGIATAVARKAFINGFDGFNGNGFSGME